MVTSALWSDVDGDGWPDLLLTLDWGGVKYFHNRQGQGFDDWSEKAGFAAAGAGWWTAIASADFNGDGRPDFVVGNVGLNTPYHADATHPALLFYGDFRGEGEEPQLVEATYEGDRLFPWRTRHDLGAAIPSVLRRYPRTTTPMPARPSARSWARTSWPPPSALPPPSSERVFLSQADGTYRFEPLPRIAQISPFQGLAALDFDGSGHPGIYVLQNSYAPIPAVGRFDGGLSQLLRGDGRGGFTPVPAAESGLVVPGDAKALAVMDLDHDGWPSFLISRNNASSLAFRTAADAAGTPSPCACPDRPATPTGHRGPGDPHPRGRIIRDRRGLRRLGLPEPSRPRPFSSATPTPTCPRGSASAGPAARTTEAAIPKGTSTLTLSPAP